MHIAERTPAPDGKRLLNLSAAMAGRAVLLLGAFVVVINESLIGAATTGANTAIVLVAVTALTAGIALLNWSVLRFRMLHIVISLALITAILTSLVYGEGSFTEAMRYALLVILCCSWIGLGRNVLGQESHSGTSSVHILFRLIVLLGVALSLANVFTHDLRATGFFATSPTLFAYVTIVAVAVLLWRSRGWVDYLLVFAGIWMILESGSRSSIVMTAVIIFLYLLQLVDIRMYKLRHSFTARRTVLSLVVIALFIPISAFALSSGRSAATEYIDSLSQRSAAADSTRTRSRYYSILLTELNEENLLFGSGAGRAMDLISGYFGERRPAHFDLLTLLVDFGLIGLLIVLIILANLVFHAGLLSGVTAVVMSYLFSGQFHNVIYSPPAILVTIMALTYLMHKQTDRFAGQQRLIGRPGGLLANSTS